MYCRSLYLKTNQSSPNIIVSNVEDKIEKSVRTGAGEIIVTNKNIFEEKGTYETFVPGGDLPVYLVLLGSLIVIGQNIISKL